MSSTFSRRGVLIGAGAAGSVTACNHLGATSAATSQAATVGAHDHHDPAEHTGHDMAKPAAMDDHVLHALLHCKAASEACLTHCITTLATGDPSLAACAERVRETAALCDASITLVTARSSLTSDLLAVCRAACEMCEAECEKHAGHHQTCADCADSCTAVIEAIGA